MLCRVVKTDWQYSITGSKAGAPKAITATARKIATIFYRMLKDKVGFNPIGLDEYTESFKGKQLKKLKKQTKQLGLQVNPLIVT